MGSVAFAETLSVDVVYGKPFHVQFPKHPVQQFARFADRKGRYAQMPGALRRMHRAMQIAVPPERLVVAAAGQTGLKAMVQTLFGSGQRGSTDYEWHPTDLVIEGARAWVRRQRWQEGGGDGWFGSPIYHDWAVAGIYVRDVELVAWADELFQRPLAQLIEADEIGGSVGYLYAPAGTNPRSWRGVEVESESFSFHDAEDNAVKDGKTQPGVHRAFRVKWNLWSGEVSVYLPEYWQIKTESEREHPVCYSFRVARNGREERRFAPLYTSLDADREFIASGNTEEGHQVVDYTTELPDLPEYIPRRPRRAATTPRAGCRWMLGRTLRGGTTSVRRNRSWASTRLTTTRRGRRSFRLRGSSPNSPGQREPHRFPKSLARFRPSTCGSSAAPAIPTGIERLFPLGESGGMCSASGRTTDPQTSTCPRRTVAVVGSTTADGFESRQTARSR